MKAEIIITGQKQSRFELIKAIPNAPMSTTENIPFGCKIKYNSLKEARKDLSHAYQSLKENEPDMLDLVCGINYIRGKSLEYDTAKAVIHKIN